MFGETVLRIAAVAYNPLDEPPISANATPWNIGREVAHREPCSPFPASPSTRSASAVPSGHPTRLGPRLDEVRVVLVEYRDEALTTG